MRASAGEAGALAACFLLAGCSGSPLSLRQAVETKTDDVRPLRAGEAASAGALAADNQRRWAWSGPVARAFRWDLPYGRGQLRVACAGPAGLRVSVSSSGGAVTTPPLPAGWNDLAIPVERRLFSEPVTLRLEGCRQEDPCGWGDVIYRPRRGEARENGVNLLFVLVDTLRADALGAYGARSATPNMDRLAREGILFERAFAQSSWTLPSVSSLLTGRWPSESPGWADPAQGVADSAVPLAEILERAGMRTAAFSGNPLVRDGLGFGRGFEVYWTTPAEKGILTSASEVVRRASAWLRTYQEERFFLYLHLMDPHDPYVPPARRVGPKSGWPGRSNLAFTGRIPLPDAATLEAWRGLYVEEVAYVDAEIGRLLGSLRPEVRARTLVVLTSDHGEEFMEHGFLKHGVTLFDEVIRVPLIFRMPEAASGRKVPEVARLVDVLPTTAELLGAKVSDEVRRSWAGVSLAAVVRSGAPMPALSSFGETFGFGALRWYAYDGRQKVVLFNKDHRLPAELPALPYPNQWIEKHTPAEAVYLSTRVEPIDRPATEGVEKMIAWGYDQAARYVRGKIGGLWLSLRGRGEGGRIQARFAYPTGADTRFVPFFWRNGDRAEPTPEGVRVDVADDGILRLAVVVGLDARSAASFRVVANGSGLPVERARPDFQDRAIRYWYEREPMRVSIRGDERKEQIFRLRALGYVN